MNDNFCPICGYDIYKEYGEKPWSGDSPSYAICPSCGVEYGYGDFGKTVQEREKRHQELRKKWIDEGMPWKDKLNHKPKNWNPKKQLRNIGVKLTSPH